ncbi:hypothetical protein L228DRAFT_237796 [Xylona heveae TC161]|uniref:Uncharacterized protein n=1 Tax=Xylona heveae (strain CBS 132557 / TC161) TaxID=1328760 RepID=A0A165HAC9_XYLHT|nr:hypothetical protein L228DRAFT_237796 [Xylona heveae TC161]KZF23209.1 hypothetical protein L228DRAFT_237796 [Xylona heveae TC161]
MAMWPFSRKAKKASNTAEKDAKAGKGKTPVQGPPGTGLSVADASSSAPAPRFSRRASQRNTQKPLNSRSPDESHDGWEAVQWPVSENEKAGGGSAEGYVATGAPKPLNAQNIRPELNFNPTQTSLLRSKLPAYYFQNPGSRTSLPPENALQRPTLRAKRSANDSSLLRRKSSKKKKRDHEREEEIKAMSTMSPPIPIPRRPTSHLGVPLRRDSKKLQGGLGRYPEQRTSEISLSFAASMQSSVSSVSESVEFRVNPLDVFSPRPTIRYLDATRQGFGSGVWEPSRSNSKRTRRTVIPEDAVGEAPHRRRIEELADDFDAGALREVMERDQRRRDRKRRAEEERAYRRLLRRSEGPREAQSQQIEPTPLASEPQEVAMMESVHGAAAGAGQDVQVAPPRDQSIEMQRVHSSRSWLPGSSKEKLNLSEDIATGAAPPTEQATPAEESVEPIMTAQAVRLSHATTSSPHSPAEHMRQPSNISQIRDVRHESTPEVSSLLESERRGSDTSGRYIGAWSSFFRRNATRGKRRSVERGRLTPSEFSNTSRESMSRQPPPVSLQGRIRARSGTPVRTQSKFREDLPEYPISPPDSRVQSPEASVPNQSTHWNRGHELYERTLAGSAVSRDMPSRSSMAPRNESPMSGYRSYEAPSPDGRMSGLMMSQSLASVDSEGSWLSGKPMRIPSHTAPLRESASSLLRRQERYSHYDDEHDENEALGITEDEYFNRLTPGPDTVLESGETPNATRKPSSTAIGPEESDGEDVLGVRAEENEGDKGTWHHGLGRQPTVIHSGKRAKSREGLLNYFQADADDRSVESSPMEDSPNEDVGFEGELETPAIERATSVDYKGKHVRHLSAGSAKLLDIPPRASGEGRRSAVEGWSEQTAH